MPLAFLLGKLNFSKEFRDFEVTPEGVEPVVSAKRQKRTICLTRRWRCRHSRLPDPPAGRDRIGPLIVTFAFDQEKMNPPLNDELSSSSRLPAGAQARGGG